MNSYYVGLLIQASNSIIAITGIFALTGLAGMFSLGQAAYMAIGAYITFILAAKTGLSFWITSLGGIGACQAAELAVAAEGGNAGIRTEDKRAGETGVEEDGQMEVGSGGEFSDDGEPQKPRGCHDAAGA